MKMLRQNPKKAFAAVALSAAALIGAWEGYREDAYIPIPGDAVTIGSGFITNEDGSKIKLGQKTTREEDTKRLGKEVLQYQDRLGKCITADLYPYEAKAYTSLSWNIGTSGLCASSIPRKLNSGQYAEACNTLLEFNKFRDCSKPKVFNKKTGKWECPLVVVKGLDNRRKAEYKVCTGQESPDILVQYGEGVK